MSRYLFLFSLIAFVIGGLGCFEIELPAESDDFIETQVLPGAEKGIASRQFQMALAYRFGRGGVKKDEFEAWSWLSKAAENHYEPAQNMQADVWLDGGFGQAAQPEKGLSLLRKLAEQGSVSAQVKLADRLSEKDKPWRNEQEATRWWRAAALQKNGEAAWMYARRLEQGLGVEANIESAWAWYRFSGGRADADRLESKFTAQQKQRANLRLSEIESGGGQ